MRCRYCRSYYLCYYPPQTHGCFTEEISESLCLLFISVVQGVLVCSIDAFQKVFLGDLCLNKQTTCLFLEANFDFFQWHFVVPQSLLPDSRKASGWLKLIPTLVLRQIALHWLSINTTVFVLVEFCTKYKGKVSFH